MYYSDAHIVAKEATDILAAAANEMIKLRKILHLKIMVMHFKNYQYIGG